MNRPPLGKDQMQDLHEAGDDDDDPYDYLGHHDGTGESTPTTGHAGLLPRHRLQTAYYGYASEKSLSLADAKQFYQRHQLDLQTPADSQSPLRRSWTASSATEGEPGGLSRTGSTVSRSGYRSALPLGLASLDKPVDAPHVQSPDLKRFDPYVQNTYQSVDPIASDHSAKSYSRPSELRQPDVPSPLGEYGLHGARAGTGVSAAFATNDESVTAELSAIYTNIQKISDMRHKYIRLSLQKSGDNPKDDAGWNIYPPHPEPVWDEGRDQPSSLNSSRILSSDQDLQRGPLRPHTSSSNGEGLKNPRKLGQDIGEDFDMSDLLPLPGEAEMTFRIDENGVYQVYETSNSAEIESPILTIPTIREFYMDLDAVLTISSDGPTKSFSFRRLQYLEGKFNLYFLLNEYQEMADTKRVPHRDFYNVRKVDTHVHHSSCMNQKHLLRFIKSKMKKSPDELVLNRDGKDLTLREVFESINLTAYDLSIDTLDMHVSRRIPQP
jgi:AMP deaminase